MFRYESFSGRRLILVEKADGVLSARRWDHAMGLWVPAAPNHAAVICAAYDRS